MGYTTARVCVYRVPVAEDVDADAVAARIIAAGAAVVAVNPKVEAVDAFADAGMVVMHMLMRDRDQWWIRRRAPHVATAVLVRAGANVREVELVDVLKERDVPPRPEFEGGRSTPLGTD